MKKILMLVTLILTLGMFAGVPISLAGEHGGKEQAGTAPEKEHGGTAAKGSHAATLLEAADALRATRPDLAAQLEEIAEELV